VIRAAQIMKNDREIQVRETVVVNFLKSSL